MNNKVLKYRKAIHLKKFLYYFEFISGFYESYFYQQVKALNEKEAIIKIVSFFMNYDENKTLGFLTESLGIHWTVNKFWDKMDLDFDNGMEKYKLIWIKIIKFDLDLI